mgnify:CR=1 FL=1
MSVRKTIKQLTKSQLSGMSDNEVRRHVREILAAVDEEKAAGRTKDLVYLYKALPGDRKTDEMKKRILPFDMNDYKKKKPKAASAKKTSRLKK